MKIYAFQLRKTFLSFLLLPLSFVYFILHKIDILIKFLRQESFLNKKIICVGNCVAGGTGKTPFCILLAEILQDNFIFLTKGYGRTAFEDFFVEINQDIDVNKIGDESMILKEHGKLYVSKNRKKAIKNINENIIITDDGMQDLTIKPDIRFVIFDANRGVGNGFLLPSGMLRAPLNSINPSDVIVVTNSKYKTELKCNFERNRIIYTNQKLIYNELLKTKKVIAFSGLGDNNKFFDNLKSETLNVVERVSFSDHYKYSIDDYNCLIRLSEAKNATLLTTQKDYVKLQKFDIMKKISVVYLKFFLSNKDEQYVKNLLKS